MNSPLIAELSKHASFTEAEANIILKHGKKKFFKKGEIFSDPSRVSREIGFVVSGVFRTYAINREGEEVTYFFFKENDLYTDLTSFHDEVPSKAYIAAVTDAEVIMISKASWKILRETVKEWDFAMRRISQERLIHHNKFLRRLLMQDASKSYTDFLRFYPTIAQRVPSQDIASFLGITRHSLSRIRKNLSTKNKS